MKKRYLCFLFVLLMFTSLLPVQTWAVALPSDDRPEQIEDSSLPEDIPSTLDTTDATSGSCGAEGSNVTWTLDGNELTISGTGAMQDFGNSFFGTDRAPWLEYPIEVTTVTISEGVTEIGNNAFYFCDSLVSLTLPQSLKRIGENAFYFCNKLKNVSFPDGLTSIEQSAFYACSSLTEVVIPDGITEITDSAFNGCRALTSIKLGSGVQTIGKKAFLCCGDVTALDIPGNVQIIGEDAFFNSRIRSLTFHEGLQRIEARAFKWCNFISSLDFPDSLVEIGEEAFLNVGMSSITFGNGLTSIGKMAFADGGSTLLKEISLPASVQEIGDGAFSGCCDFTLTVDAANQHFVVVDNVLFNKSMSELLAFCVGNSNIGIYTIPDSVVTIHEYAFRRTGYRNSLNSVIIPATVQHIQDNAFYQNKCKAISVDSNNAIYASQDGVLFNKDMSKLIAFPTRAYVYSAYEIPDSVITIGHGAFADGSFESITIPDSVTTLEDEAFTDCNDITIIRLPNNLQTIPYRAFYACNQLATIIIPLSVTSIELEAFRWDNAIRDIYYAGSEAQWANVNVVENAELKTSNVTMHYNSSGPLEPSYFTVYAPHSALTVTVTIITDDGSSTVLEPNDDGKYLLPDNISGAWTLKAEGISCVTYQVDFAAGEPFTITTIQLLQRGNINGTGSIDVTDIQALYAHLTGTSPISDPYLLEVADMNEDGVLDVYDLQALYEYVNVNG
mgnify:FL=1